MVMKAKVVENGLLLLCGALLRSRDNRLVNEVKLQGEKCPVNANAGGLSPDSHMRIHLLCKHTARRYSRKRQIR